MESHHKQSQTQILQEIQDYMFTARNLTRFTKHIIPTNETKTTQYTSKNKNNNYNNDDRKPVVKKPTNYSPKQKDSLFWCLYILKNGYFNYEMEINNQYFVVEKKEKYNYVEELRKSQNKDLIKLHKIKPFTELEDDLANKDKISIKTFFALCVLEKINVLLVDKRKIYELICVDIDEAHPIHVIHRNSVTFEHYIELNTTNEIIQNYRDNYYKMESYDATLKSMGSYKLDELQELCRKLDINMDGDGKKKKTKADIYQLLVLHY
jgi:hypothetical protein